MALKELMDEVLRQVYCLAVRSSVDLRNSSGLDLGSTIGRCTVARTPLERLPRTPPERSCVCYRMRRPRR